MGLPLLLGLAHAALVAPRYFVGSFDDDAGYILAAKGLLAGSGLAGHLASGESVIGLYPPGYSALLAPLVWLWPHTFAPLRLLSLGCYAAVFPMLWLYLGHHRVDDRVRTAALVLLALGPVFATYATMVMAEAPFLVVLMSLLLALDRWGPQDRVLTPAGLAVVGSAAGLVWLKQAGVGLVVGLLLWLAFAGGRGRWARTLVVAGGVALSLVPVLVARTSAGIPLAGARYSQELGGFYQGGLGKRLIDVVPGSTWHLLSTAIPATLVPYLDPLPLSGPWSVLWQVLSWHVTLLAGTGAVVWLRRHRDAAVPMVVVYLGESVLWPFVNERRAVLVLPLLVSWYVVGGASVWQVVQARAGRSQGPGTRWSRSVTPRRAGAVVAAVVVLPLLAQAPRDYLYPWGRSSSHFGGSRYAQILARLGGPSDVVETDYRSSTALFTGHLTNWNAFVYDQAPPCSEPYARQMLRRDHPSFLLLGDLNKAGLVDSPCLAILARYSNWAVQILHTRRDEASVYELIGPGTAHPGLTDLLAGAPWTEASGHGQTAVTWSFPTPSALAQLSVGQAAADTGTTDRVVLDIRQPDGTWSTVATARGGVGDGRGRAPFLLVSFPAATPVTAVRVEVDGPSAVSGSTVSDVAALGPARPA